MTTLKKITAALLLTCVFAFSAFAGEVNTPPCPPPDPGEVNTPPCSPSQLLADDPDGSPQVTAQTTSSEVELVVVEATVSAIENMLAVF